MDSATLIEQMIRYEEDELTDVEVINLFSWLIRKGLLRNLQGHYGCAANSLIAGGYITPDGMVQFYPNEE